MHKRSRNFLLLVIFMILLPLGGYILYALGNLKENERIIQKTYNDQLQAILFSLNQYSNDFMSSLMSKLESDFDPDSAGYFSRENLNMTGRKGFSSIHLIPFDQQDEVYSVSFTSNEFARDSVINFVDQNTVVVKRLNQYFETGYRKLEPVGMVQSNGEMFQIFITILKAKKKNYVFIGLIEPLAFTEEVLRPRMQQIAEEQMIIALSSKENNRVLYATDSLVNQTLVNREMWLFPELNVGITPKSSTIQQIVKQRFNYNLYAISLLAILLIVGFTFLFRNVNREMTLAQNKADFVSSVSHELRTPLALISMFAETLIMGRIQKEEKKKEYYEIIFKETNRLTNIVNRILNFSKIEANKRVYSFDELDLAKLVEDVVKDYSFHLEQNGFEVYFTKTRESTLIRADRDGIYEGIVNLLDNAIKYSPETKEITIKVEKDNLKAWVEVADKGIGIPADKIHHIFDKFYRATEKDIYKAKGAGLGLTILKHIMDSHGGKIEVKSKEGSGSSFKLIFNLIEKSHG